MDDVPVKIAERYKRPPVVYQLPKSITNKIALGTNYYNENPQFQYDFQLERDVLTKVQYYRQMRQKELEERQERIERREQERQREIEIEQKEMLGAVHYPSAEELSSSDDEILEQNKTCMQKTTINGNADESTQNTSQITTTNVDSEVSMKKSINAVQLQQQQQQQQQKQQTCNFHNILQPTVLSQVRTENANAQTTKENAEHKPTASFNLSDFEYDNSSPFDSVELKTINDLDILAQVLHNTQLAVNETKKEQEQQLEQIQTQDQDQEEVTNKNNVAPVSLNETEIEITKATLKKVNFNYLDQNDEAINIPNKTQHTSNVANDFNTQHLQNLYNNYNQYQHETTNYALPAQQNNFITHAFLQNQNIQAYHMQQQQSTAATATNVSFNQQFYNQKSPHVLQQYADSIGGAYNNHNYLIPTYCNEHQIHNYGTPTHQQTIANTISSSKTATTTTTTAAAEASIKSKSVPNILRELKTEACYTKTRRTRNLSQNMDTEETQSQLQLQRKEHKQIFNELAAPARKLAQNISSMGFPLERVAKVISIYGIDDKKIIEHLIPLSELIDLGFDETKISKALLKFNNNKDKALDYLIS